MSSVAGFVVQESIHADWVSRHVTREDAIAAIEEIIREGVAEPGAFYVREIDDRGETVRGSECRTLPLQPRPESPERRSSSVD